MGGPVDGAPPPSSGGPVERGGHHWWQVDHLADDEPPADAPLGDVVDAPVEERHDTVEYDLSSWSGEQVHLLNEQLDLVHITHEWHHGALQVAGRYEAQVDDLIDTIDEVVPLVGEILDYELPDWTPQQRDELAARLVELDVNCRWDGYLLSVGEADEATVDAAIVAIDPTFPVTTTDENGSPDLGIPERPWWSEGPGEMVKGFLGLDP